MRWVAYYDHDSGHVLATIFENGVDTCTGPASFVAPSDCYWPHCAADASADASADTGAD